MECGKEIVDETFDDGVCNFSDGCFIFLCGTGFFADVTTIGIMDAVDDVADDVFDDLLLRAIGNDGTDFIGTAGVDFCFGSINCGSFVGGIFNRRRRWMNVDNGDNVITCVVTEDIVEVLNELVADAGIECVAFFRNNFIRFVLWTLNCWFTLIDVCDGL